MARIVNQNNEVIAKKDINGEKEKTAISKTSLIVGTVLSIALVAVIIILIIFLTKKESDEEERVPTMLEQYVSNYKKDAKSNFQIEMVSNEMEIAAKIDKYKGECYILCYDCTWMEDNEYSEEMSSAYQYYLTIDNIMTGYAGTKTGVLSAMLDSGDDIHFFIVDYSNIEVPEEKKSTQEPPHFTLENGKKVEFKGSPELFHLHYYDEDGNYIEYADEKGNELGHIIDGHSTRSQWSRTLNKLITEFKTRSEKKA